MSGAVYLELLGISIEENGDVLLERIHFTGVVNCRQEVVVEEVVVAESAYEYALAQVI